MRTDPREACANDDERWAWAWVHDAICHPLMALSNWAGWSLRFHDWTSHRAWPRAATWQGRQHTAPSLYNGDTLTAVETAPGVWSVKHPAIGHTFTTQAKNGLAAIAAAERWFWSLSDVGITPFGLAGRA